MLIDAREVIQIDGEQYRNLLAGTILTILILIFIDSPISNLKIILIRILEFQIKQHIVPFIIDITHMGRYLFVSRRIN